MLVRIIYHIRRRGTTYGTVDGALSEEFYRLDYTYPRGLIAGFL